MEKNLNKFTRAELIEKIGNLNKLDLAKNKNTEVSSKNKPIKTSTAILDIFNNIKKLIISLSIITILMQIFKKYKSIRAILKLANYIIITLFGISIFEAFGLGFIVKFLGELKYIFGAVVAYLTDSTFYNYLMKMFNISEEKSSIRTGYKKPVEEDWKAELEKAERKREWEKWLEKHSTHKVEDDEAIDKTTIMLTLLFLVGSLGIWYYGKEALDIVSPVWNIGNAIRRILRGGRDDDNLPPTPEDVQLDPDNRAVSPDMLVYSSELIEKKITEALPASHPARFDIPPPPTTEGPLNPLLDSIKLGKKLKPTETVIKSTLKTGKVLDTNNMEGSTSEITSSSQGGMLEQIKNKLDKLRPMITGDDDLDDVKSGDNWEEQSGETTPTNLLDKGKKVERSIPSDKKAKFLDSIKIEGDNIKTSDKIAPILKSIKENFPNLSDETLKKLSTREGLKNRREIIESLSEHELSTELPPLTRLIEKGKTLITFEDLKEDYKKEFEKESLKLKPDVLIDRLSELPNFGEDSYLDSIINRNIDHSIEQMLNNTPNLNKQQLIEKLIQLNPLHKDLILDKVSTSIDRQLANMENSYSEKDFKKIKKVLTTEDLKELQSLGENKTIDQIKTLKAINKSHNNLLSEIKRKSSETSVIDNSTQQLDDTMNLFD